MEEPDLQNGSLDRERDSDASAQSRLGFTHELELPGLPYAIFVDQITARRFPHVTTVQWMTDVDELDEVLPYATATGREPTAQAALLDLAPVVGGECLAYIRLQRGYLWGHIAARELPVLADAEEWTRSSFPRTEPAEDKTLPLTFWSAGAHGAHVRHQVQALLGREFHPSGGQLILWYGPPGTGKTHALRSLAWEWRSWCETHYVTDPERFFGNSSYMLDVLLQEDEDGQEHHDSPPKWRMLILEDTGELLAADAKEQAGQGLSRLLNVVDGIIGQGLRVLVLVTTNEPLKRLHPAISRPGRCAARIEFGPFPASEASEWLAAHDLEEEGRQLTLAEMFALQSGAEIETGVRLGFSS